MSPEERDSALTVIGEHRVNYWSEAEVLDALVAQGWRSPSDVAKVCAIHQPLDAVMYTNDGGQYMRKVCTGCGTDAGNWQTWPCPTIRAIEGAQ